jgi:hypothetical protein
MVQVQKKNEKIKKIEPKLEENNVIKLEIKKKRRTKNF